MARLLPNNNRSPRSVAQPLPSYDQSVAFSHGFARALIGLVAAICALLSPNAYVGAEDLPAYDQRMLSTLSQLDLSPATSQLRDVLDRNRVSVHFIPMAPGVYARYSVARHVIEIDDRWLEADETTLAAVIAHEATHAQDAVSGYLAAGGASACIDSEVRAFRTSALFWLDHYGRTGKLRPSNEVERQLNAIADRQLRDPQGLEALVKQTYTQQCSH
jgi:hypothetical protein